MPRLWTLIAAFALFFTRMGPTKPAEGEATADDGEPAERTFYDPDPDDPDEDFAKPEPKAKAKPEEDEEDEEEEEDEDDTEDEEEEEDEEGDDDEEEEEDDEDDEELSTRAQLLDTRWESELAAGAARGEGAARAPNLQLDKVALRKQARDRFKSITDTDENGEKDPEAIFEIAMDAALQIVGAYHFDHAAPETEKVSKSVRNAEVNARLGSFKGAVGEALTPALERKMASIYTAKAEKHGWRLADKIPFEDLFAMAGGTLPRKGKGKKKTSAKKRAERQKAKALGATHTPRRVSGGRPTSKKKVTDEERDARADAEMLRDTGKFFTLGI